MGSNFHAVLCSFSTNLNFPDSLFLKVREKGHFVWLFCIPFSVMCVVSLFFPDEARAYFQSSVVFISLGLISLGLLWLLCASLSLLLSLKLA